MSSNKIHIIFRVVLVLYAAAVGYLCFADFDPEFIQEQSQLFNLTDKDVHFLMFAPFVILTTLAFGRREWKTGRFAAFAGLMLLLASALAFLIELIQGQTDYRGADVYDALAGIAGAAAGAVVLLAARAVVRLVRKKTLIVTLAVGLLSAAALPDAAYARHREDLQPMCDSLAVRLQQRTGVRADKLRIRKVLRRGGQLDFYFENTLGDYPWHDGDIKWLRRELKSVFPEKYSKYSVGEIFVRSNPLKDYVTPRLTSDGLPAKSRNRVADPGDGGEGIVRRIGAAEYGKGLSHRNIALWQSHGYYYEQSLHRWEWQRACLFRTVEDMFTPGFVLPYLVPMLENAGAYVMLPRERDLNTDEYIIDNDCGNVSRSRGGFLAEGEWMTGGPGFADTLETIVGKENPFLAGTALYAECGQTSRNRCRRAVWRPDFAEDGEYAVYVAYRSLPESSTGAHYSVRHRGGETEFLVNQRTGGGTWIYLGTFPFDKGSEGCVVLDCGKSEGGKNAVVCADAVRFGGGTGCIARFAAGTDSFYAETSGMPRFAEAARYSLQWYGAPESVWSQNGGENDYKDDYMCRGSWVDWLSGGSRMNPDAPGLGIPVDLAFAFHTDAGTAARDTTVGTMAIYSSVSEDDKLLPSKERRTTSREYADIVQTQVVSDIRALFDPDWTRRGTKDRAYLESRTPTSPSMILELLSHQNFNDMKYGLDPAFRFTVCRAVYKGMLKYLSNRYGRPYAVQPLPPASFACAIQSVSDDGFELLLHWKDTPDTLEPTAVAEGYVIEIKTDDGEFTSGAQITEPVRDGNGRISYALKLRRGHIYGFRIRSYNDGGISFPSETLAAGIPLGRGISYNTLIVNNFTRVAAPSYIETPEYAGFDDRTDSGVDYVERIDYIGNMYQFRRDSEWRDDDCPGFGASYTDKAGTVSAGNTFDYPLVHGKALFKLGRGFASMSRDAFCECGAVFGKDGGAPVVDLICGKQVTTPTGTGKMPARHQLFPSALRERLRGCCSDGCSLIVSGAYIGTDIGDAVYPVAKDSAATAEALKFAAGTLGYRPMNSHGGRSGEYRLVTRDRLWNTAGHFCNAPGGTVYCVEAPDGIVPADGNGRTFLRYRDTGISAGVCYEGDGYRTVCIGFPLETVCNGGELSILFGYCLDFFNYDRQGTRNN